MTFSRQICAALLGVAIAIAGGGRLAQAQTDLKIYNWSDYINPAVLDAFTRETGTRVIYDTYDQIETVEAKLRTGKSGYDLAVVPGPVLARHVPLKLYAPLDRTRIANLSHVWPDIARKLARYDAGNRHAVPYLWGTTGLGYNLRKIRERLGPDAKVESWAILFNPETLKKLAPCGVHVLDSPEEMIPAALIFLGLDPDSRREADWRKATDLLTKIRPHIQKFHSSDYISALASGDICLVAGLSGDVQQARKRALAAGNGVEIGYAIPKEGALIWLESFVIPADAGNAAAAHRFLDFINRPEVAALNAGFVQNASGNLAAQQHLPPGVTTDRGIYPASDTVARLHAPAPLDEPTQRALHRLWQRVKSGK